MTLHECVALVLGFVAAFSALVWSARVEIARGARCVLELLVEVIYRHRVGVLLLFLLFLAGPFTADLLASTTIGGGPWQKVGEALCVLFVATLGKALAIVAVVIGGLMYAFGEGGSKSQIAGLAFGAGMVLMAPEFLFWLLGQRVTCDGSPGGPAPAAG